jgi:monofunctional biosynthetic peptidoglycan transglycosylase
MIAGLALLAPPALASNPMNGDLMIIDFRHDTKPWPNIDDVVMGGRSSSGMQIADGFARFAGSLSLENNGGFASVRSLPREIDLSEFDGLVLRLRGDGNRYKLRLRTTQAYDGVSFQAVVEPVADEWQEITVPFTAFEPVFRGRKVRGHPDLDTAAIKTFGLLISDRQQGRFHLDVEWIKGWRKGGVKPAVVPQPDSGG